MIRQQINVRYEQCDWKVRIYYVVTQPDADEILRQLIALGCSGDSLQDAQANLSKGLPDTGLTYSSPDKRKSIMVIAKTSTAIEFACSWQHEVGHLKAHIAETCGMSLKGEDIQYLGDEIFRQMWPVAKNLICDCCRS